MIQPNSECFCLCGWVEYTCSTLITSHVWCLNPHTVKNGVQYIKLTFMQNGSCIICV